MYKVRHYIKNNGRCPIEEFLINLEPKLRAKAFHDIEILQEYGTRLNGSYMKSIKGKKYKGLYELRIKFSNDIARIFYFTYYNQEIILLNGFIKKTMKTPKRELDRAKRYMDDFIRRRENG
ncbi:MAG: type II toxin-antitoxin system RelE/ParE family toxin [Eubacterium sp.]|nr:type II toxin-antitoxin system RelE/ParE family toxin [Eubacterium sp.]